MHAKRSSCYTLSLLVIIVMAIAMGAFAQEAAQPPAAARGNDVPEIRMKRWGLSEDPGDDPDPTKIWIRNGLKYQIHKYDKKWARFDVKEGWVRPNGHVGFAKEIYRQDDQHVWVWTVISTPDENQEIVAKTSVLSAEAMKELTELKKEFVEIPLEKTPTVLKFMEASNGLPKQGSWRNALDVGDMNNDGFVDIISPAQRGSISSVPEIFLGDGKGNWKVWANTDFERSANYGSVSVGDINHDGNLDIVCGVHLYGIIAFVGDGKGKFDDASNGLPTRFPTRRVRLHDVDRDGDLDIVALTEGPTPSTASDDANALRGEDEGKLRIYLNEKNASAWTLLRISEAGRQLGGDWLTVGNLNGDKYPDIIASSIVVSGPDILWLGRGATKWKEHARGFVPWQSLYWANTVGRFSSKNRDDAILAFGRTWFPRDKRQILPPDHLSIVGLERVSWSKGKLTRTPIARWPSNRPIWAMGSGDFDGDKNEDVVYWNAGPRTVEILLGDGKGGFKLATIEGMDVPTNTAYDVTVADVNDDRKPDIVIAFESQERGAKDGSIRVWLNQN